jgi:hypothetical protein
MVNDVMARIGPAALGRRRPTRRLFAGLAASGLLAAMGLAWLIVASRPTTLLAAVQDGLEQARSAYLAITVRDDQGAEHRAEIWYRRGEGLRFESPEQVIVEDGKFQWSWRPGAIEGNPLVMRQRSAGFFTTQLPSMLAMPDVPADWKRDRTPALDRAVDGHACGGYTVSLPGGAHHALVLAETDGRIREIDIEQRGADGTWRRERAIRIDYDVPVPAEKVALRLPAGAQVVDRDEAFEGRYPLEQALHQVELGGLILAVHDVHALQDREGFYVVSSVRGTPAFLEKYPPRRRPVNPELVAIDVAFQPGGNGSQGGKYIRIVLGSATRGGVEFSWWLVVPRRFFEIKDGQRIFLPENDESAMPGEPGRLDDLPGVARVPLSATYWDEKHRDPNGTQQGVSTWAAVPLPDRPPATLVDVASRARRDVLLMGSGGLLGIATDAQPGGDPLKPMSHFAPEAISDADFAAAVQRGLDDLRQLDEVHAVQQ